MSFGKLLTAYGYEDVNVSDMPGCILKKKDEHKMHQESEYRKAVLKNLADKNKRKINEIASTFENQGIVAMVSWLARDRMDQLKEEVEREAKRIQAKAD